MSKPFRKVARADLPLKSLGTRGFGLLVALLIILAVALTAPVILMTAAFLADQSKVKLTQEILKRVALAVSSANFKPPFGGQRSYEQDVGALPGSLNDLLTKPVPVAVCSFNTATQGLQGWCGPYWAVLFSGESNFVDEWGRTIVYDLAGRRVYSIGPNNVDDSGGGDDLVQTF